MPRQVVPLSDTKCEAARFSPEGKGNKLADGGGLFLQLKPTGAKSWRMKYIKPNGKEDLLVFGDYPHVTLKMARLRRDEAKGLLARGIDPKAQREADALQKQREEASSFEVVALAWHELMKAKWSPDYAERYLVRLRQHLFPDLASRPVGSLTTRDLMQVIRQIERQGTPNIASRMKMAITGIMRYAIQEGLIDTNPALDLVGSLQARKAVHRPSLPLNQLPDFLKRVDAYPGRPLTRYALQLNLLVFIRSSELRFARWGEVDFDRATWLIPGEREVIEGVRHSERGAKMRSEHLVPLSQQALRVFSQIRKLTAGHELIFPGDHKSWRPMSENTINAGLRRLGYDTKTEVCGHGFRTMACSALIQSGLFQEDAVERQMSHQERNSVRLAYTHSAEFLIERKKMMQWWSDYLDQCRVGYVSPYEFSNHK